LVRKLAEEGEWLGGWPGGGGETSLGSGSEWEFTAGVKTSGGGGKPEKKKKKQTAAAKKSCKDSTGQTDFFRGGCTGGCQTAPGRYRTGDVT